VLFNPVFDNGPEGWAHDRVGDRWPQFSPLHNITSAAPPTIAFFGPESPALYRSLDPEAVNYFLGMSCSPCLTAYNHRNSPCDGDNACLKDIRPEEVIEKGIEILRSKRGRVTALAG
jgi:hypothetical protein